MHLNESVVEDAALEWLGELGYVIGHGPHLAPGEPAAERDGFGDVVLAGRLREAIRRLNPAIPEEAREDALRTVLRAYDRVWPSLRARTESPDYDGPLDQPLRGSNPRG